uniref:Medium-chain acyl-CoA ligase ACSF2, mitochondrial n=1 Tax=Rhipicephalus zambeziensis TaxID=60191 RepID=A0A224YST2_9ACAR
MAQACKQAKTLRTAFEARRFLCRLIHRRAADYKNVFAGGQRRSLAGVSYHHNPGKQPLLPLTIGDVVDRAADQHGDNVAIVSCHQSIRKTYSEYKKDIDQLAAALVSLKLRVGSKIAIIAPNMYEWAVVQFATAKAGLVLVNINTAYQVPELEYALHKTGCETVIFSARFARQDYYKMLLQIAPELESSTPGDLKSAKLPKLKHVISISDETKPGAVTYADLTESVTNQHLKDMHAVASRLQFDDPINLQFTSGTTGKPKAAQLSHFNVVNNGYLVGERLELDKQVICLNVPLIHCFGCVGGTMAAAHFGATIAFPAPGFKAEAALNCIQNEKCTHIYGTPTMYIDILHHLQSGQYDVSSVKRAVMAGSPCPPEVIKRVMNELNAQRFFILYGATETSPVITATTPDDPLDKWIHSVGKPVQHTEVKIVDKENKIVPTGQRGELCARGYLVFMGYFDDEENTRKAVRNGWYHTGDEAVMAEDGRISIMGRIKDMIIRGGENVYPQEIEDFLYTHPAIEEVQVVGVPDKRMGEEACAWIILKSDCSATEEDIKSFCKGKLSHFKIPRYIFFVDTFPKTLSGKVQKFALREKSRQMLNL